LVLRREPTVRFRPTGIAESRCGGLAFGLAASFFETQSQGTPPLFRVQNPRNKRLILRLRARSLSLKESHVKYR
jgi:hypothetical protein